MICQRVIRSQVLKNTENAREKRGLFCFSITTITAMPSNFPNVKLAKNSITNIEAFERKLPRGFSNDNPASV